MSSSFYEILELSTGEIILRRNDETEVGEPLLRIQFSDESKAFLGTKRFEVAKAMIEAGMETVNDLMSEPIEDALELLSDTELHLLH